MPTPPELDPFDDDDDVERPVGLLGALRRSRVLVWVVIVGVVALSVGAGTLVTLLQR